MYGVPKDIALRNAGRGVESAVREYQRDPGRVAQGGIDSAIATLALVQSRSS